MSSDKPVLPTLKECAHGKAEHAKCSAGAGFKVLGGWLAAGRIACGYNLEQFSSILRIQQFYLEALEQEDLGRLPARPYVSGYVRSYALRANLDPREANRRLQQVWPAEVAPIGNAKALEFTDRDSARGLTMRRVAGVLLVASIAGYASWYFETVHERQPAALSPVAELEELPRENTNETGAAPQSFSEERRVVLGPLAPVALEQMPAEYLQQLVVGQTEKAAALAFEPLPDGPFPRPRPGTPQALVWGKLYGQPSQAVDDDAPEGPASQFAGRNGKPANQTPESSRLGAYLPKLQLRADLGPLNPDVPSMVMTARGQQPAAEPAVREPLNYRRTQAFAAVPPSPAVGNSQVSDPAGIILAAAGAASWIEIKDESGKVVLSRLLKDGQSVKVPDRQGLSLTTGNAGALVMVVNGVQLPALGGNRAVVRGIALDPERLLEGNR